VTGRRQQGDGRAAQHSSRFSGAVQSPSKAAMAQLHPIQRKKPAYSGPPLDQLDIGIIVEGPTPLLAHTVTAGPIAAPVRGRHRRGTPQVRGKPG